MNQVLTVMFGMAILLALSLGAIQALRQVQLKIGYSATAESLYRTVNEYVGQACASGDAIDTVIHSGRRKIFYTAFASCPGVTGLVPALRYDLSPDPICRDRGEPGYIDADVVDLHGAAMVVYLDSTPPVLTLLHGFQPDQMAFLSHLSATYSKWLPYDVDADGVADGVYRPLQTRARVADGLWLAAAGVDTSCTQRGGADAPIPGMEKTRTKDLACQSWTETVVDDKFGAKLAPAYQPGRCNINFHLDCYYTSSGSWDYGQRRFFKDDAPDACATSP